MKIKQDKKIRRKKRTRAKIFGTKERPRLSVFRSNKHIHGQVIDDQKGRTLVSASDLELKPSEIKKLLTKKDKKFRGKTLIAYQVGQLLAKKANIKKIKQVVFNRGPFKYHGRLRALAEGARQGGLQF
jgi:large subunit ribosomal protein L18